MKRVRLWSVGRSADGAMRASDVATVDNTETEQLLEDLLVQSPELLMDGLTLVGRQIPTEGGPLDLLGIDQDGGLVVFELKRGALTRDAVAQVLDYASDLAEMDVDRFARLVQDASGRNGVETIEDFLDWYGSRYQGRESALETPPRMVLVGLGVDGRATRIANFLAKTGVNISVLTFNAFRDGDKLFLARQVESEEPRISAEPAGGTRQAKLQVLKANAQALGVEGFLDEVSRFVRDRLPGSQSPGKNSYSYSLMEYTADGHPTYRVYLSINLNWEKDGRGTLWLWFSQKAVQSLGGKALSNVAVDLPTNAWMIDLHQARFLLTPNTWSEVRPRIDGLLQTMVERWKAKTNAQAEGEAGEPDAGEPGLAASE